MLTRCGRKESFMNETCSDTHKETLKKLINITREVHDLDTYARILKENKIAYEDYYLADGRQIAVYTGSSGYDIVGICAKQCGHGIALEALYS